MEYSKEAELKKWNRDVRGYLIKMSDGKYFDQSVIEISKDIQYTDDELKEKLNRFTSYLKTFISDNNNYLNQRFEIVNSFF